MHLLTIQIQQLAQPLVCRFKAAGDAEREYARLVKEMGPPDTRSDSPGFLQITDDYSHEVAFWSHTVTHAGLIDLEQDLAAQAEVAVFQARAQARANQAVSSDPMQRLLSGAGMLSS